MISRKAEINIVGRIVLLLITLSAIAFLLSKNLLFYSALLLPVLSYQIIGFYRFHRRAYTELSQFVESIHYRDFSRNFDVKNAPQELRSLRKGFNEINSTFKIISKEKETQYQYLQKILELVDTGILSYRLDSGEVIWMNESLKNMLELPYLKTIHSLLKRDESLYHNIIALKSGDSIISTAQVNTGTFKILLSATAFQTDGEIYKLIAFQNVEEALDETESKAWQRLLSVMTHEIMNSIAPISSLADTLKNRLLEISPAMRSSNIFYDDLELGVDTIKRRSEGLLRFAETYRSLNKITNLTLKKVYVRDIFENLSRLMQPSLDQKNIELQVILKDTELLLEADVALVEQVLINLIVNSMEAVKERPAARIVLSGYNGIKGKVILKVGDNGAGMSYEVQDKIFIPFFTTKKNGSGIGLSLCKQIMMLHKGSIQVHTEEEKGTSFLLHF